MPEANENEHEGVRSQTLRTESIRPTSEQFASYRTR